MANTEASTGENTFTKAVKDFNSKPWYVRLIAMLVVVIGAIMIFAMGNAEAVGAGSAQLHTFFEDMWEEVKGLMTGAPAKIAMGLTIIGTVVFSMIKPNLIGFLSCVVTLLVLANAATTIDGSLTVTVEALAAHIQALKP